MAYADTENKKAIRLSWDKPLLARWHSNTGKELSYLGLTGPEIHDILDWRDHLSAIRTGVESPGRTAKERLESANTIRRLNMNLMINGLSSGFQLLRADVEDIFIHALDNDKNPPQLNDGGPAQSARFAYDLLNLDFDGGLGYKDGQGNAKRITALKKVFERQKGHSFILFLTVNHRHTLGDEIKEYIKGLQQRGSGSDWNDTLNWYLERGDGEEEYKLKITVPHLIRDAAETNGFKCVCFPPVAYVGHKSARMVHFAFELEAQISNMRFFSPDSDTDLVQLPLLRCDKGLLQMASVQHPNLHLNGLHTRLSFLAPELLTNLGVRPPD